MSSELSKIHSVPTNIITGFLGAGKTSAILHLLAQKPADQRWAVLVNEFGEIGVDGTLLQGQQSPHQQVFIREVPGGCMCCTAGLPMQTALNQLLKTAQPDRLLIEPTGLGHPKEVLQTLQSEHYQQTLSLQETLTLVDARKLSDQRYTSHDTFNQQIAIADIVIGNKIDLYQDGDKETLIAYVKDKAAKHVAVMFVQHSEIDLSVLAQQPKNHLHLQINTHHHHHSSHKPLATELPFPPQGFVKAINQGEEFYSVGWRFRADKIFNHERLSTLFTKLSVERMKAVFITDQGLFGYNLTADGLTQTELDDCDESRIEIISQQATEKIEHQILDCVIA